MATDKAAAASRFQAMQILLLVFSFILFSAIAYGWYNLFLGFGWFPALILAFLLATFAWFLARVVGTNPRGIRGGLAPFIMLLLISALGVYNTAMLYSEGGRILADTANEAQTSFGALETAADAALVQSGAAGKAGRVKTLSDALFSEIRNPLNCGQGPEAHRLMGELQHELEGFTPLSDPAHDCSHNDQVIADYRDRIGDLVARAPWNNPQLIAVAQEAAQARQSLGEFRAGVMSDYTPTRVHGLVSTLETQDAHYRDLRFKLSSQKVDVSALPPGLHLSEAQSLGNVAKLPDLFFERLNQLPTWVYLGVAVFFDFFLVRLFTMVTANRVVVRDPSDLPAGAY